MEEATNRSPSPNNNAGASLVCLLARTPVLVARVGWGRAASGARCGGELLTVARMAWSHVHLDASAQTPPLPHHDRLKGEREREQPSHPTTEQRGTEGANTACPGPFISTQLDILNKNLPNPPRPRRLSLSSKSRQMLHILCTSVARLRDAMEKGAP